MTHSLSHPLVSVVRQPGGDCRPTSAPAH